MKKKWLVIFLMVSASGLVAFVGFVVFVVIVMEAVSTIQPQGTQATMTSSSSSVPANAPVPANLSENQYVKLATNDALAAGIPPNLFIRQINQESGFNPNAISPAGAVGIAQFIPSTAAGLGIDPRDPVASLKGAAQLMARYYQTYGDFGKALAAYNAGGGAVNGAIAHCGPQWLSCLPAETQHYVAAILT
jgi:soluble lytic murein transglycosylase-like protein